ncbi:uncharacterized protein LAESUDRAFT_727131 [Laetiporus sulphureus 93-53]|uniref:Actin-like ATPase domain-containing protein n=1 Tax=Laetiporus sulphureus 93-53 TaxID=1314785 RepID=A0A165DRP3_9APHY|nr:uncharacterized protein LAESUDRAFT_727131 [Laetiporus sulphureus 93-53]KZT05487.1 hypothetical protein LAESUDRAFT_727131 [Laetiporus sulphureus 93-53]
MPLDKPYSGTKRKLVLGIDVGTTYSGVSFCILDPGEIPQIRSVTCYPGQEGDNKLRDTKIPTIVYYDEEGTVRAVGAEARLDANRLQALDEGWVLAQWFKLHLRPRDLASDDEHLPTLPPTKTVIQIIADFMRYIYKCAKEFISEKHPTGRQLLQSESNVEFVLTHPNGWGGSQQAKMRRAAVLAGLVPDSGAGQSRIHFVTEGEASLHYCITNGLTGDVVKTGNQLMIVDAGGGTVDLSTYRITSTVPAKAVESIAPDCVMQGSTFVNDRAGQFLRDKLGNSRFSNDEDIQTMLEYFENSTKPTFRDSTKASYIRFGGPRDTDEQCGIKRGTLSLSGSEMATLFRPSVSAIENAMRRQSSGASGQINMVLLVGGFAASPHLRAELQSYAQRSGLSLFYPDSGQSQPAKAVAEGALSHYLDDVVSARVSKYAYGSSCSRPYIPFLPAHTKRQDKVGLGASGIPLVPDAFSTILPKGTLVSKEEEFEESFVQNTFSTLNEISSDVTRYKGSERNPQWMDEEPEMFDTLCTIRADISHIPKVQKRGMRGDYYEQDLKVILLFGLTEFKAQLSWMENVSPSRRHGYPIAPTDNGNCRVRRKGTHS